ncbi:MAG: hypothetical protein V3R81_04370 [Gammaproteobacteria bacterium]
MAPITMMCFEFQGTKVAALPHEIKNWLPFLAASFNADEVVVVAHNSGFDVRCAVQKLGLPQPKHELCTLDLAQGAYPNQAGGYSLDNLSNTIPNVPAKLDIDLADGKHTEDELKAYCMRDVEACAAIYQACVPRISDEELALAELTSRARQLSLVIDQDKGRDALDTFTTQVQDYAMRAAANLTISTDVDMMSVFGLDSGNE